MTGKPEPTRELTDSEITSIMEDAYQKGFNAGLKAATPAMPLFEAALDTALHGFRVDDFGALDRDHLRGLLDTVEADYQETLGVADRNLIEQNVQREVAITRARTNHAAKPRAVKPSERGGRKPTEYEVVR